MGFAELMVVAVVGLFVLGPDRLPGAVRTGTVWVRRVRHYIRTVQNEIEDQMEELDSQAAMTELKRGRELFDEAKRNLDKGITKAVGHDLPDASREKRA